VCIRSVLTQAFKCYCRIICASYISKPRLPVTIIIDEANFLSDLGNTKNPKDDRLSWDHDSYAATNFYRQVQSSVLLGHVLYLINSSDPFSEESQSRFRVLDSQLLRAIQVTLQTETAGKLNSVSEALSLNRRYCPHLDITGYFLFDTGIVS